ncbi:DUF5994 family protein [Streptomyces sp. NPDC002766]|uniref:DUF5994 family protein n=1 Tax=Streptomyces sp. NPDC002766 TaxID=3154429 RepID=UPI003333D22F
MPLPRLALASGVRHGPLDGAWWPRCGSLELELPSLVAALGRVGVPRCASPWTPPNGPTYRTR